ncbi:hypothetical protein EF888_11160 [Silicimonas algicola]|uniref:Uncharacterized protein n=1 Tax=Silicimonas algicola TaxID=1826607 RepID=A0A316GAZ3_9RHOB|nr:hypothetical protein [Silicimonas algicola]AZQ67641.1 hypothetical protein EF888_11160 [Silicimonas algicola]PWK51677.1 hypothetical protein C8D95_11720 [Silicimonas algicola]
MIGSFGKSMLCPEPGLPQDEVRRRQNRLGECIGYVRWQARRHRCGRVLVVTYQAVEAAFTNIPNVETLHFNAVAGLDRYKDVACLIVIGRPLPSHIELEALAGGYFGATGASGYTTERTGVRTVSGDVRGVRVIRHRDATAEDLRAAICDDELVQAIGRGRGVNRTVDNPLEVHVLADVAPPLAYDKVTTWDVEAPDVVQRMLLAGIAVDSPADAAVLHPQMFESVEQAKKAFQRAVFKGQNPMKDTYREMSLKSAAYRRSGRGVGWQTAYWVSDEREEIRHALEETLRSLADWRPH